MTAPGTTLRYLNVAEQLANLLKPFPASRMKAWPVLKDVKKVGNQGLQLADPVD